MTKPIVVVAALAAMVATVARRRQAQADSQQLWHEATADASR